MKRIKSFKFFESKTELEILNETRFYFLNNFYNAIKNAPIEFSDIRRDLLDLYGDETNVDITFVDLDKSNTITYSTQKNIEKEFHNFIDAFGKSLVWIPTNKIPTISDDILKSPTRAKIKIGRFLNKVINTPKKYPESLIDKFVVYLQSQSNAKEEKYTFKVVKGDEITKYYDSNNYAQVRGSLGNSCMNDRDVFDIYTKNPEVCSLLVMLNSSDKLVARAFIWDVDIKNGFTKKEEEVDLGDKIKFLDRVYSIEDWMVHSMTKWAKDNGLAIKTYNHGNKWVSYNDTIYDLKMEVPVNKIHYSNFPYVDTFNFYDVKAGKLLNYSGKSGLGLQSTQGNYGTATGYSPRIRNYIRKFK
jgi:hypothetical protein